jgi:hypothetical protein
MEHCPNEIVHRLQRPTRRYPAPIFSSAQLDLEGARTASVQPPLPRASQLLRPILCLGPPQVPGAKRLAKDER